MNWIDLVILVLLAAALLRGLATGLIISFFNLVSIAGGLAVAAHCYSNISNLLIEHFNISAWSADIIGFITPLFIFIALVQLIAAAVSGITRFRPLRWLDRAGGAAAGLLIGAVGIGIILILLTAIPVSAAFHESLAASLLAPKLESAAHRLYEQAEVLLPLNMPRLAFHPEELSGGRLPMAGSERRLIDFSELDGSTCIVCEGEVRFLGYFRNDYHTLSPKYECSSCGRTSDGCQTFEGHHLLYGQCPAVLGRQGYRFDCGIWTNGYFHRPTGRCPVCGESGRPLSRSKQAAVSTAGLFTSRVTR